MAFVYQPDGPFVVGANSYAEVAFFKTFWTDRDPARLAGITDPQIQEGLINGSEWIDGFPWIGLPTTEDPTIKRLGWPRIYAVTQGGNTRIRAGIELSSAIVPYQVREATCVVGMEDITERVSLQDDPREKLSRKKIGPIEKDFAAPLAGRRFPLAEQLVLGLWKVRGGPPGAVRLIPGGGGGDDDDRPPLRGERLTDLEGGRFPGGGYVR